MINIKIKIIKNEEGNTVGQFITNSKNHKSIITCCSTLISTKPSTVLIENNTNNIIKIVKARRSLEKIKLLWLHSRLQKEISGAKTLNRLGFKTPRIFEQGIAIPFTSNNLGYYIMENLTLTGMREAEVVFLDKKTSPELRQKIIITICDGLLELYRNKIVFTDFHLGNVFSDINGNLTWIDTGVTKYHIKKKRNQKFIKSTARFLNYYGDTFFLENEKDLLLELIKSASKLDKDIR
ncbi:MAG: hypothetical protein IBX52_01350 [Bacterioplanes sp.]|nr:hypothetical protein [Bacterioplanes sp.]